MPQRHPWFYIATIAAALAGCQNDAPPPARVPVPAASNRDQLRENDVVKPMPDDDMAVTSRPRHADVAPPAPAEREPAPGREHAAEPAQASQVDRDFLDAYHKVGEPRLIVFVNRTLDGHIVPVAPDGAGSAAPADQRDYLRPGQYDAANAHAVDYQAFENRLAERFGQGGKATVISPELVREKLGDAPAKDLQDGRAKALSDLDRQLGADVLIQVQMRPTKQSNNGLSFRVVAEAINVNGGQSIGHAFADVDPPLDAQQLRGATRYLSEQLMADMIQSWSAPTPRASPPPPPAGATPVPPRTSGPQDAPPVDPAR